jgi:hypothetical protein
MTTSPSPGATSPSPSSGASPSSLPRWQSFLLSACNPARHLGATLNWRRDPGYEQKMLHYEQQKMLHYEQRKMQHEQRMNANRIAIERSKERTKLIEKDTELIEKEIKQLRQENVRLKALNASVRRLCFPPESSSTPQTATAADCKPS